jgi:hypothetical protein
LASVIASRPKPSLAQGDRALCPLGVIPTYCDFDQIFRTPLPNQLQPIRTGPCPRDARPGDGRLDIALVIDVTGVFQIRHRLLDRARVQNPPHPDGCVATWRGCWRAS